MEELARNKTLNIEVYTDCMEVWCARLCHILAELIHDIRDIWPRDVVRYMSQLINLGHMEASKHLTLKYIWIVWRCGV